MSTPITWIFESAPPAACCCRTVAVSGGSSALQLGHQDPKNRSTAGVPSPPPSAGTATLLGPLGPTLEAENVGTGPPWVGAP